MAEKDSCVFCRMVIGEIPVQKIYENGNFFSIPDANPFVDGHSLIISKKHFKTFLEIPDSLGTELLEAIKKTAIKLMDEKKGDGFNILNNNFKAAGQVVGHVHFHILPRKKGDGFNVRKMMG